MQRRQKQAFCKRRRWKRAKFGGPRVELGLALKTGLDPAIEAIVWPLVAADVVQRRLANTRLWGGEGPIRDNLIVDVFENETLLQNLSKEGISCLTAKSQN